MPCQKHSEELEGRSDLDCEACDVEDKAEMAYWFQLYQGEKQAGLLNDPEVPTLTDLLKLQLEWRL